MSSMTPDDFDVDYERLFGAQLSNYLTLLCFHVLSLLSDDCVA